VGGGLDKKKKKVYIAYTATWLHLWVYHICMTPSMTGVHTSSVEPTARGKEQVRKWRILETNKVVFVKRFALKHVCALFGGLTSNYFIFLTFSYF
jgi:hypothetical protein